MMKKNSFTLIELLVVVAIIGILVTILMPSLSKAKEMARRAVCLSNLKQMGTVSTLYGNDNSGRLNPSLGPGNTLQELHWIGTKTKIGFDPYIGDWTVSDCPNWRKATIGQGMAKSNNAYMMGFTYSGGLNSSSMVGSGNSWEAPVFLSDDSSLMLFSDRITTSNGYTAKYVHV